MRVSTGLWLGLLAVAAPAFAFAQATSSVSTYTPGREQTLAPFILRGTAVGARGGGPRSQSARVSHRAHGMHSDNQTRRPGAANYTGASFKDGSAASNTHTIPSAPGVSMIGDNFSSHTGSHTTGRIPVRAPSPNEP